MTALGSLLGIFLVLRAQLPQIRSLGDYAPPQSTMVYSDDGQLVGMLQSERRTVVPFSALPRHVVLAFLAAEDANFYEHEGIDYFGIMRAAMKNLRPGAHLQGASTITQQTVKTLLLGPERSYVRKLREAMLAHELEKVLSKDEILHIYLNQIYFGNSTYGVEAAAQMYFGKSVRELSLGEGALLAAVPKNPGRYNIKADPVAAKSRQRYVLEQMQGRGWIDGAMLQQVVEQKVPYPADPPPYLNRSPHYLELVRRTLVDKYGEQKVYQGGLTVVTGMHAGAQAAAYTAVRQGVEDVSRRQGYAGAPAKLGTETLDASREALHRAFTAQVEARNSYDRAPPAQSGYIWDLTNLPTSPTVDASLARRYVSIVPLAEFTRVRGLVVQLDRNKREATIDLGGVVGRLPLKNMAWARRFNPSSYTPRPKDPADVLHVGELVTVEISMGALSRHRAPPIEVELVPEPSLEGALVAIDPQSRLVRAVVGSYRLEGNAFNRATQALRQPGSAFKPVVYAAGLTYEVITPASLCADSPVVIIDPWTGKAWKPENFEGGEYAGNITYRTALMRSKNTCSVRLMQKLTPAAAIDVAAAMGINSKLPQNLTLALGTGDVTVLELTNAIATIADQGLFAAPIFLRKVLDGETLLEEAVDAPTVALAPPVAYVLTTMMRSVVDNGTGRRAQVLERPLAGKTGTSQESRNVWFVGFAPQLAAGVWLGFDNNDSMGNETGSSAALPAWIRFMGAALAGEPAQEFMRPEDGVVTMRVNRDTGYADDGPNSIEEVFVDGTEPSTTVQHPLRSIFLEDEPE